MVKISDDARDMLRDFAERHAVSVAALLEAFARRLPPAGVELHERLAAAVEEARAIDVERRRRG